jgi:hypothetical protein
MNTKVERTPLTGIEAESYEARIIVHSDGAYLCWETGGDQRGNSWVVSISQDEILDMLRQMLNIKKDEHKMLVADLDAAEDTIAEAIEGGVA